MPPPESPGIRAWWWSGLSGGVFGGSAVGIAEALYVLSSTTPSEYQALAYGAVLYGLIGATEGVGVGVFVAVGGRWLGWSRGFAWAAGFFTVAASLGAVILNWLVDRTLYQEQGIPRSVQVEILAGLAVASLVGLWLGTVILTKTPLRVLAAPKGTVVGWALLSGLCFLFSLAPSPWVIHNPAPHHPQAPDAASKPDVLLIHIDALRSDALGVYGAPGEASPNLDAFAGDAVVFEQNITQASWTRASTASLFTSLPPSSHACDARDSALSPTVETLAEVMQRGGYATGGLPNNANVTGALGFGQGFDDYPYQPQYPLGAAESTYALSFYSVVRKWYAGVHAEKRVEDYYMPAETQLARALDFITRQGGDRWFLYVHLMEPHDPYFRHPYDGYAYGRAEFPHPEPEREDELRALYAGEVRHADAELGAFFTRLRQAGVYDRALIIVTSDHGEEFLDHGGWWHGTTLYDEQIHVPLLVKLPGNARAGTRVPWQVRSIDIAPTIAEIAAVEASERWRGEALIGDSFDEMLALGSPPQEPPPEEAPTGPWAAPTWADHPASREALSEQDFEGYHLQSLRVEGRKLIEAVRVPPGNPRNQPRAACFDVLTDPGETHDLAGTACETALTSWLARAVDRARAEAVADEPALGSAADADRLHALGYAESGE